MWARRWEVSTVDPVEIDTIGGGRGKQTEGSCLRRGWTRSSEETQRRVVR